MPDYYQWLNIKANATSDEIRKAYLSLAHAFHPDKQGGSTQIFVAIKDAYDVLIDPVRRKAYDDTCERDTRPQPPTEPRPTRPKAATCQSCEEAFPLRRAVFLQNIGLIFTRHTKRIEGNFCKGCIENYFWRYTLTTLVLGWWGVISFFVTVGYLLHNCFVFIKAATLEPGVRGRRSQLYSWAVLACVVALGAFSIARLVDAQGSVPTSVGNPPIPVVRPSQQPVVPPVTSQLAKEYAKDPKDYVSLQNGKVFSTDDDAFQGLGEVTIKNGTGSDAIVKLIDIRYDSCVHTVYIKANSKYNISEISDGNYKVLFNLGKDWNKTQNAFNINSGYNEFGDVLEYETTETEYMTYEISLNPVAGGDVALEDIDPGVFAAY